MHCMFQERILARMYAQPSVGQAMQQHREKSGQLSANLFYFLGLFFSFFFFWFFFFFFFFFSLLSIWRPCLGHLATRCHLRGPRREVRVSEDGASSDVKRVRKGGPKTNVGASARIGLWSRASKQRVDVGRTMKSGRLASIFLSGPTRN